jgi:competence protein ComEA
VASAGGFLKTADQSFVAKNLNLATELQDQDKVYIPFVGENDAVSTTQGVGQSSNPNSSSSISINQADAATLQTLSGIGEAKSKSIIEARPYSSLQELVDKKILSESLFADLKEQLSI